MLDFVMPEDHAARMKIFITDTQKAELEHLCDPSCDKRVCDRAYPFICEYKTINEYNVSRFFNEIRKHYPDYHQKVHVILDGAGYHRSQLVKDWAEVVNITLHYLPPYSPNLNPVERMWKLMNEHARNSRYFSSKREFREVMLTFFSQTLPKIADSLTSRINDHFQVLKSAS